MYERHLIGGNSNGGFYVYLDMPIADSLEDFLKKFINDNEYYINLIEE